MPRNKQRILIVDDMDNGRRSMARLLELSGYEVSVAVSGEDALKKIEKEKIDLTLMDVVMPGIGGLETACRIKTRDSKHPVVLISAYASNFFRKYGLPEGIDAFLSKPFDPEVLLEAVRKELPASSPH